MKRKTHPDRSVEASSVRDELSHDDDALRALDAVAREDHSEVSVPPIPEDLREQWEDRYGTARAAAPEAKKSWKFKFSDIFMYGGGVAMAALAILMVFKTDIPPEGKDGGNAFDPPTLRGGAKFTPTPSTPVIFIANYKITFKKFAKTRKTGPIYEAYDQGDISRIFYENKLTTAVILEADTGMIYPWPGQPGDEKNIIANPAEADEFDFSEALDAFLQQ